MSNHASASEHVEGASRPSNPDAYYYEIDLTGILTGQSFMEVMMNKSFKHLAGEERRTAIKESLGEAEHKLKEHRTAIEESLGEAEHNLQNHSKSIELLEEKIFILKRFLSGA